MRAAILGVLMVASCATTQPTRTRSTDGTTALLGRLESTTDPANDAAHQAGIVATIHSSRSRIAECYEPLARAGRTAQVTIRLAINGEGIVERVTLKWSGERDAAMASCMDRALRTLRFPARRVEIETPVTFKVVTPARNDPGSVVTPSEN